MIVHVVLFEPRPDLTTEDRRAFVAALERAIREIPTVRGVRIGRRVTHGAGYEAEMPGSASYLAMIEFGDTAGLQAYLDHPAHHDLAARFRHALAAALVYDFEIVPLAEL